MNIHGRRIPIQVYGELAFQNALDSGQFHTLADRSCEGFSSYWWGEICRFEAFLAQHFSTDEFFISDHVQPGKIFILELYENQIIENIIELCFSFLLTNHPDASICITQIFKSPASTSSFVFSLTKCGLDHDAEAWFTDKAKRSRLFREDVIALKTAQSLKSVPISCLFKTSYSPIKSPEFWRIVYSGAYHFPMKTKLSEDQSCLSVGSNIIRALDARLGTLTPPDYFASSAFTFYRSIKIECTPGFFEQFGDVILETVGLIDKTWGIRCSIFNDLRTSDSYLGGVLITPSGSVLAEDNSSE
jgi:hypothetical protein